MHRIEKAALLVGCAAVAIIVVSLRDGSAEPRTSAVDLLDPRYVAANACGGIASGRNELFKPGVQLALAARAPTPAAEVVPLYQGLGTLSLDVTTDVAEAQAYFDQGLRLTMAFNHAEAVRSFRAAQDADPSCAMCYWGEAYALGPTINTPMDPTGARPAFAATAQARVLAGDTTPLEQALIAALAQRYALSPEADRVALDGAFADAMVAAAEAHPESSLVATLAAEALMNTQPWDYWEADKRTPKGRAGEIVALLEHALALDPTNPGAIHLYIHAVEASATPERAEAHADRLAQLVTDAGHLVHMPSHIYYRIGRYQDSLDANRAAVAADERFLAQTDGSDVYRYGYYPHNVHYLLVSAQMAGARGDALAAAEKLASVMSDDMAAEVAWIQAIKTAPYTAHALLSDPAQILALPAPPDRFPFVAGFRHYARAIAHVRTGDLVAATAERNAIDALLAQEDFSAREEQFVPGRDLLTIARNVVDARVNAARGDYALAVAQLEEAASLQDTVPYMEPPYWYYPVRQTLGAVLHAAGDYEAAADAYQAALLEAPNNAWTLWGLQQTLAAQDDAVGAKVVGELLARSWVGDDALLTWDRL